MTKLYYTCPIQAAYMAKEFGVITVDKEGTVYTTAGCYLLPWDNGSLAEGLFCIIDDCSPIFEPQEGDMDSGGFVFDDDGYWYIDVDRWYNPGESGAGKIIQRNDKPFFWPLAEEE